MITTYLWRKIYLLNMIHHGNKKRAEFHFVFFFCGHLFSWGRWPWVMRVSRRRKLKGLKASLIYYMQNDRGMKKWPDATLSSRPEARKGMRGLLEVEFSKAAEKTPCTYGTASAPASTERLWNALRVRPLWSCFNSAYDYETHAVGLRVSPPIDVQSC